jgi:hypothetical protein
MQHIQERNVGKKDDQREYIKTIIESIEKNAFDINILTLNILASTQEDNLLSLAAKLRTLNIDNKNSISKIQALL